jgi:hypothetical protein
MHPEMETLRCAIVRGGTSKGVFIMMNEYPKDPAKRDAAILAVYGSPDLRQIDGLGGADVLTSKHAIISRSSRPDADVDYTFAQVSFESAFVDYGGNCGNISSAVGPFAIDEEAVEPITTTVRIRMTNSDKILVAEVPVKGGKAMVDGDFAIDGVPGTGAKTAMDWSDVVGSITGKLLPTGNAKDAIEVDGVKYTVSIVDAGNPVVFVHAASLHMKGTESPNEIESDKPLMETIEKIRGHAAVMCRMIEKPENAKTISPYVPFFFVVSPPADYKTINGTIVKAEKIDVVALAPCSCSRRTRRSKSAAVSAPALPHVCPAPSWATCSGKRPGHDRRSTSATQAVPSQWRPKPKRLTGSEDKTPPRIPHGASDHGRYVYVRKAVFK